MASRMRIVIRRRAALTMRRRGSARSGRRAADAAAAAGAATSRQQQPPPRRSRAASRRRLPRRHQLRPRRRHRLATRTATRSPTCKQADFDVTEDGKPQKIETFKLIKLDGGTRRRDRRSRRARSAPTTTRRSEAARDDVRLFAIFLDDYHVRARREHRRRANQLAHFIETQLGPSDMVGVMYPLESTASVRMTRNHSAVMRGLQQFLGRKYDYTPRNQFEETLRALPDRDRRADPQPGVAVGDRSR